MNAENVPSVDELAELLSALRDPSYEPSGREETTARWLISQVPETRELWAEMSETHGEAPSLDQLACFVFATHTDGCIEEGPGIARWLLETAPSSREIFREYEQALQDAGVEDVEEWVELDSKLERLIETVAFGWRWSHSGEVLDAAHDIGTSHRQLRVLCQVRLEQAEGRRRELLEEVARRLDSQDRLSGESTTECEELV